MDDQISRQAAIKIIKNYCENGCDIAEDNWCPSCQREQFIKLLEALPSAQPDVPDINVGDMISREELFEELNCINLPVGNETVDKVFSVIENMPSAQPERKTGHWLIREGISDAQCSECGMYFNDVYDMENSDAFCRHCGTKMEGLKVVKNE